MKFYNGDLLLPIYNEQRKQPCKTKSTAELIIWGQIPTELVASDTPVYVKNNAEFTVNADYLGHWRDIKTDMIINMSRTATKTFYYNAFDPVLKLSNKQSFDYKLQGTSIRTKNIVTRRLCQCERLIMNLYHCFLFSTISVIKNTRSILHHLVMEII